MAKANATKVPESIARQAVELADSRQSAYSECVLLSYRTTGKFGPGFDARDLQAWIDLYAADQFTENGNKIFPFYVMMRTRRKSTKKYPCKDYRQASAIVIRYRDEKQLPVGMFAGGNIYDKNNNIVAHVDRNGEIEMGADD